MSANTHMIQTEDLFLETLNGFLEGFIPASFQLTDPASLLCKKAGGSL